MANFDNFISSLRSEFGEQGAGKKFEVFCKWFLENDPRWSKSIDKVWLWDDYPNKWQRQDLGTDLVFRDKDGLIWAVQSKCYSEHRATTKGDMNSFLADTGRKEVDRRLWLQTTNKMEAKADKTLKGQDKPVTVFNLNDFRDAQIDYPATYSELNQAKLKDKPTPDPHQVEAIEAVHTGLKTLDRGQMIMACGTGKTFTTLWIKEALKAHTTLVLLPSLSLLSQTMREWAWAGNTDFEILNVCSDKSVGKKTEDMEVSDAPFPVTSEPEEIAKFIKRPEPKVIFCTYQSSPLIAEVQLDVSIPTFDLIIADEAHRCAGKADASFGTVLDDNQIRSSRRLFTTATPRYFGRTIKDAAKARDLAVVGMDDETVFGPVLHKLTFGQAIEKDLLNDYQVVIVGVDEPMVKQWIDEQEIVSINTDKQTDARTLAAKIGLIKAIKDYDLKRVISFHSRVKGAKDFSEEFHDVIDLMDSIHRPKGVFLADYVSGIMKAGDRKDKIDRLKLLKDFDVGILSNSRCLAEGVDVPSLDGVAFIDPKGSQIEIIQAVGRAIRKVRETKVQTKGTIVIPVFIEAGDDPKASIEESNFKPIWDVLKALRAHDEILADTLDNYRTSMAKNAKQCQKSISDKVIFDIPAKIDVEFSSVLRTVLVEASTASWEFWFGLLEVFKGREGHCLVNSWHKEGDFSLGNWVSNQRSIKDKLTSERLERLNALDFVWDANDEKWEENFNKLQKFKEIEGHCRVPNRSKIYGASLGNWVLTTRRDKVNLTPERIARLNEIGFSWDPLTEQWEESFAKLQQYKEREGNCFVHNAHKEDGHSLGTWVISQRVNKDKLTPERLERLNDIGFIWDLAIEYWETNFNKLKEYFLREGHTRVPRNFKEDGISLGSWVSQRRNHKEDLSSEQIKRLNELNFIWDPIREQWEANFNILKEYFLREGHSRVPKIHKEGGISLGSWVSERRSHKEDLSSEQIKRLNKLNFVWDPETLDWEEGFSKLKQYKEREGHLKIPRQHNEGGFRLGAWDSNQRSRKDKLTPERLKRLNTLGFVWDPLTEQWEEGFSMLQQFREREGHCKVLRKHKEVGYPLDEWVSRQRAYKDKLTPERLKRLNTLGFIWDSLSERWEEGFSKLKQYKEREGHCNVPKGFKEDGHTLGNWIVVQRKRRDKLTSERLDKLNALGFILDPFSEKWELGFSKLKQYKEREGHFSVPKGHKEDDLNLKDWISTQRKNRDKLNPERIEKLHALGFVFDPLIEKWELGFSKLKQYKEREGHCRVIRLQKEGDFNLGHWVYNQKQKKDKLTSKCIERLDALGFDWSPITDNNP
ncbi:Helicase associated domain protein [Amylibacter sp.]|nr:Helicase associated domain protein [Amylibacter sp.]